MYTQEALLGSIDGGTGLREVKRTARKLPSYPLAREMVDRALYLLAPEPEYIPELRRRGIHWLTAGLLPDSILILSDGLRCYLAELRERQACLFAAAPVIPFEQPEAARVSLQQIQDAIIRQAARTGRVDAADLAQQLGADPYQVAAECRGISWLEDQNRDGAGIGEPFTVDRGCLAECMEAAGFKSMRNLPRGSHPVIQSWRNSAAAYFEVKRVKRNIRAGRR